LFSAQADLIRQSHSYGCYLELRKLTGKLKNSLADQPLGESLFSDRAFITLRPSIHHPRQTVWCQSASEKS
jgi:hypothetical protein